VPLAATLLHAAYDRFFSLVRHGLLPDQVAAVAGRGAVDRSTTALSPVVGHLAQQPAMVVEPCVFSAQQAARAALAARDLAPFVDQGDLLLCRPPFYSCAAGEELIRSKTLVISSFDFFL